MANKAAYDNDSIEVLKGADRVRKKPAVIFGSDGIEGCEHAVFEIISNSVDEAREGFGDTIVVTRFEDKSVEVQDFGRGLPVGGLALDSYLRAALPRGRVGQTLSSDEGA